MDIEHATIADIARELGRRDLHGVLAVDDMRMDGSDECGGCVMVIGHPTAAVGMADEAIRRARESQDKFKIDPDGYKESTRV